MVETSDQPNSQKELKEQKKSIEAIIIRNLNGRREVLLMYIPYMDAYFFPHELVVKHDGFNRSSRQSPVTANFFLQDLGIKIEGPIHEVKEPDRNVVYYFVKKNLEPIPKHPDMKWVSIEDAETKLSKNDQKLLDEVIAKLRRAEAEK